MNRAAKATAGSTRRAAAGKWIAVVLLTLSWSMSGCTWVSIDSPAAERVRVAQPSAVENCRKVGATKARTQPTLGIFDRSNAKVAEELQTMARNDAPGLGGDTVVAEGPISLEGVQDFGIYDCSGSAN